VPNRNAAHLPRSAIRRRGFTMTELTVAATLLVGIVSVITPLAVRSGRVQRDTRCYLAALDELSNQLDRLTALDSQLLPEALEQLAPSAYIRGVLPSPELSGEVMSDGDGRRLVLRLSWDRPGDAVPLTLVGWLAPPSAIVEEAAK